MRKFPALLSIVCLLALVGVAYITNTADAHRWMGTTTTGASCWIHQHRSTFHVYTSISAPSWQDNYSYVSQGVSDRRQDWGASPYIEVGGYGYNDSGTNIHVIGWRASDGGPGYGTTALAFAGCHHNYSPSANCGLGSTDNNYCAGYIIINLYNFRTGVSQICFAGRCDSLYLAAHGLACHELGHEFGLAHGPNQSNQDGCVDYSRFNNATSQVTSHNYDDIYQYYGRCGHAVLPFTGPCP